MLVNLEINYVLYVGNDRLVLLIFLLCCILHAVRWKNLRVYNDVIYIVSKYLIRFPSNSLIRI